MGTAGIDRRIRNSSTKHAHNSAVIMLITDIQFCELGVKKHLVLLWKAYKAVQLIKTYIVVYCTLRLY